MDILKALRVEESKFLAQMEAARQQVNSIRAAIKLLGGKSATNGKRSASPTTRRKMSAEGRARIAAAQKKRWAAIRKAKKAKTK
jgi:hypothetical protein